MNETLLSRESETLFIPLLGKSEVNKHGNILEDKKAGEIVNSLNYDFTALRQSKFINIYMGIRAAILDAYAIQFIKGHPEGIVLHLGCGLDSRAERIKIRPFLWVDVDLPDVIEVRKRFFKENGSYRMLGSSVTDMAWLDTVAADDRPVLVIAEGLTMYLSDHENKKLFLAFQSRFKQTDYIFDAYSLSAVKWSKWKNPVNKMGASIRWGLDNPDDIVSSLKGVTHVQTKYFTGKEWSDKLSGSTKLLFKVLYGNAWANSLYRIYCFKIE